MMPIIDSSVFIASFLTNDSQHVKAQEPLGGLERITCTEYVVLEVVTALRTKKENALAYQFLDLIRRGSDVEILHSTPALFSESATLFRSGKYPKLSFVDTSLVVLSRHHKVATFDRSLSHAIAAHR